VSAATATTMTLSEASRRPDSAEWRGPKRPYDLVKEFVIALVVIVLLVAGMAVLFSSPDDHPLTIQSWANNTTSANGNFAGQDFLATAMTELDGSSPTASYGPPYNPGPAAQKIFFLSPESWFGVRSPIDTANNYVLTPLRVQARHDAALAAALAQWDGASSAQQATWTKNYETALSNAKSVENGQVALPPGDYGPLPVMMDGLLAMAQSGALDNALLASRSFYGTDYTKPLLYVADGGYLSDKAQAQHLAGSQWGMMNETGNYPGQAWLWLYTMWYQVWPFTHTGNADALVWSLMMLLTLLLLLLPLIPGLRSIPKWIPVYKAIWRQHYRALDAEQRAGGGGARAPTTT
jgi:hypothetical protein